MACSNSSSLSIPDTYTGISVSDSNSEEARISGLEYDSPAPKAVLHRSRGKC